MSTDVAQPVLDHAPEVRIAGDLIGREAGDRKQRLVVEHLFATGHQPAAIGVVAMKAAADVIVNATGRSHAAEVRRAPPSWATIRSATRRALA